jgi:hypothetical protein
MRTASKKDNIIQSSRRFPVRAIKPAGYKQRKQTAWSGKKPFDGERFSGRGSIIAQASF